MYEYGELEIATGDNSMGAGVGGGGGWCCFIYMNNIIHVAWNIMFYLKVSQEYVNDIRGDLSCAIFKILPCNSFTVFHGPF